MLISHQSKQSNLTQLKNIISKFHKIKMGNGFSIQFFHVNHWYRRRQESANTQSNIRSCESCLFNHKMWYGFVESCAVNKINCKIATLYMATIRLQNEPQQSIFLSIVVGHTNTFFERPLTNDRFGSRLLTHHESHSRKCDMPVKSETEWTLNSYK